MNGNLFLGLIITIMGLSLVDFWFDVYKTSIIKIIGKEITEKLWFKIISALIVTVLIYLLITYVKKLKPQHFGIKRCPV